jgi:signal transduction histidine kinase
LERQRRFAADASHELRTPITAKSGHARMLDEWALEEDQQRAKRSVGVIRREAGNKEGRRCSGLGPCAAQHPGRGVGVVSGIGLLLLS